MPWGAGRAPGRANGALMSCLRAGESFDILAILWFLELLGRRIIEQRGTE